MGRLGPSVLLRAGACVSVLVAVTVGCGSPDTGSPSGADPDGAGPEVVANRRTDVRGVQEVREPIVVTPDERDAFLEVAMEPAVTDVGRRNVLQRWERDPTVAIGGAPSPEDRQRVDEALARWALITGRRITLVAAPADIDLQFVPRAAFATALEVDDVDPTAVGLTRVAFAAGRRGTITSASIVVASDDDQVARNRTIAHELGHAMGLQHSTCASSLMDGSSDTERSVRWSPSPLDVRMGALLYDPRLTPGLARPAVEAALAPTATEGTACGPVDLELVRAADSGRQYFCARLPERVRPCTSTVTVEPTLPITNPDAWTDGASLTTRAPR